VKDGRYLVDAKNAATFVVTLLKEAQKQGLLKRLLAALKKKPRILLLGCTGTGKTNLLNSLIRSDTTAIRREDRTLYTEAKNLLVKDKLYRFIDTTGDLLRKDDRVQAMREAMAARGGIAGIINVVCYGYHEYDVSRDKVFSSESIIKPEYLERHRQEETKQLDEWTFLLGDPVTSHWLITVVTKADLWWNIREEVMKYYGSGAYYEALGDARTLRQRVLPYSSVFHRFYGEAPMAGTFDQAERDAARERLINALIKALLTKQGE
jgi:ethanolamine utilization protein EutP (predicted NTPase)